MKDLWYAGRILAPISGPQIDGLVAEADELSDVLGDHNDLAVLLEAAGTGRDCVPRSSRAATRCAGSRPRWAGA